MIIFDIIDLVEKVVGMMENKKVKGRWKNQQEYIKDYNKENYVSISFRVKSPLKEEFNELLKKNGFSSYRDFIEKAIEIMKDPSTNLKAKK